MPNRTPPVPRRWPLYTLLSLVLSFVCFQGFVMLWQRTLANPVAAYDIQPYLKSQLLQHIWNIQYKETTYHLDSGVIKARAMPINRWLQKSVYRGQPWWAVLYWPLWGTGICTLLLFVLGVRADMRYRQKVRLGLYVRGTEEISVKEHNRRHSEPGFRLQIE
jgi:hypothetical protein